MNELLLQSKIEGLLFYKGEPVEIKDLAKILKIHEGELLDAVEALKKSLVGRGLTVIRKDDMVSLVTVPELSDLINGMRKEELTKDLSKASLETLSVILYKNGATRSEIDYIRGVNSSFILRNLSIRGLVERIIDPNDSRRFIYKPTFDLLTFLGITEVGELPDFKNVADTLIKEMYSSTEGEQQNEKNEEKENKTE